MSATVINWIRETDCMLKQGRKEIEEIIIYDTGKDFNLVFRLKDEKGKSIGEFCLVTKRDNEHPREFKNLHRLNNYLREHFKGTRKVLLY